MVGLGEEKRRVVEDATCLGCPCLCDDIRLVVESGRVVEAGNACEIGREFYGRPTTSGAIEDGAIERAAELLGRARAPVVIGLGETIEAQRAAVAIADRIGAAVEVGPEGLEAEIVRRGMVGATLGEVRDRADLVVFHGASDRLMPRFRELYLDRPGRFVPDGRAGRFVVRVSFDVFEGEGVDGGPLAGFDLAIRAGRGTDWLAPSLFPTLRAVLAGARIDREAVERTTGVPLDRLVDLIDRMKAARYGVLVLGGWTSGEALALVRDLNRHTRFVAIWPTRRGSAVLTWQGGNPTDVDFSLGRPRHLPGEGALMRASIGEADAALLLGPWPDSDPPCEAARVEVGPDPAGNDEAIGPAAVAIRTSRAGIDEGGTVARFDGVLLPLRPALPSRGPSQAEVLRAIDAKIAAMDRGGR